MKLRYYSLRYMARLAQALARIEGVPVEAVYITAKPQNQIRLMNWQVWATRYSVSLDFVIHTLLRHYNSIREHQRRSSQRFRLGLPIAAVTGAAAQRVVEQAVAATYPAGENWEMLRSELRMRMLSEPSIVKIRSGSKRPPEVEYALATTARRRRLLSAGQRFPRAWRGNPWL